MPTRSVSCGKPRGPLWSVWTSTGSTHLQQQCWCLQRSHHPWLGGSISLVSVPWRYGEALLPSYNALPKAATTLLNFTNWRVVREGGIAALTRFHKFQVQIEDSSLTGFSHPLPICLEVEGRWVDVSTDCSVPHLAWKLFWSLLKEGPDQSELCVFSGVLWDKGWSEVDIFIPGGVYPSATVGWNWEWLPKRVKIRPEMYPNWLVKKKILPQMTVLFILQFKKKMFPAT